MLACMLIILWWAWWLRQLSSLCWAVSTVSIVFCLSYLTSLSSYVFLFFSSYEFYQLLFVYLITLLSFLFSFNSLFYSAPLSSCTSYTTHGFWNSLMHEYKKNYMEIHECICKDIYGTCTCTYIKYNVNFSPSC